MVPSSPTASAANAGGTAAAVGTGAENDDVPVAAGPDRDTCGDAATSDLETKSKKRIITAAARKDFGASSISLPSTTSAIPEKTSRKSDAEIAVFECEKRIAELNNEIELMVILKTYVIHFSQYLQNRFSFTSLHKFYLELFVGKRRSDTERNCCSFLSTRGSSQGKKN